MSLNKESKAKLKKPLKKFLISLLIVLLLTVILCVTLSAEPGVSININGVENPEDRVEALDVLMLLTILALLPSILIMMTSFTRIIIVLSLMRNAIGLQQTPPNQVLIGLALFLTLFIMAPVIGEINDVAYEPYVAGTISQREAVERASVPLRTFMLKQTNAKDLNLFLDISGSATPETYDEISMTVVIPAFITSELKRAFLMGFFLYIPFVVIDMVVSSTLMSLGMIMLPPASIAMPFKILLFVLVDGWGWIVKSLVTSFVT